MRERRCLACSEITDIDQACDIRGEPMAIKPNHITICFYCGHIMAFDDRIELRELSSQEMYEVAGDPVILHAQEIRGLAIEAFKKAKQESKE